MGEGRPDKIAAHLKGERFVIEGILGGLLEELTHAWHHGLERVMA